VLEKAGVWPFNPPENYDPKDLRGNHKILVKIIFPKAD
jgi:hypothetical protein